MIKIKDKVRRKEREIIMRNIHLNLVPESRCDVAQEFSATLYVSNRGISILVIHQRHQVILTSAMALAWRPTNANGNDGIINLFSIVPAARARTIYLVLLMNCKIP